MTHTLHSKQRLGQRGFNQNLISIILEFGSIIYVGDGVVQYQVLDKDIRRYRNLPIYKVILSKIDLIRKKAVLVSEGKIITLINVTKRRLR